MILNASRLIILFLLIVNSSSLFAQVRPRIRGVEEQITISKRHRLACNINETKSRKVYNVCSTLYDEAKEEIDVDITHSKWRGKINRYYKKGPPEKSRDLQEQSESKRQREYRLSKAPVWLKNCKDFFPGQEFSFAKSDSGSCLAYGDYLLENQKLDGALKYYRKACGRDFIKAQALRSSDEKLRKKGVDHLKKYGCVTLKEEKLFSLKNVPICTRDRLLACQRVGLILRTKEETDLANKFFTRACDGRIQSACEAIKDQEDRWSLILYTALAGIFLSVFIFVRMLFQEQSEMQTTEQLEEGASEKKDEISKHGIILKYSRPFFKHYISPVVSSMKMKKKIKEKYKQPLASSGLNELLTPEDFFAFKLFLIIGFPIVFLGVRTFLEETWPLSLIPVLGGVGFFYPDMWIKGKIQQRQEEVMVGMPFCVDMLALSVEAGLDFVAAMSKVVEKGKPGPIIDEFTNVIKEIKIGASRAESLRNMAYRVDLIQITSFTATLIAADSVGASIGPILKNLSKEIREKRSSEAEKKGAQATTKILFPMMAFIMPAVLIIIFAPIVVEQVTGGR
jgi:tight adherence protein C